MANIFVYGGVGIAAGVLPNRRAPNLTRISCLLQEDERLATRLNEEQLAYVSVFNMAVNLKLGFKLGFKPSLKLGFETKVKLSIGLKLDFSVGLKLEFKTLVLAKHKVTHCTGEK